MPLYLTLRKTTIENTITPGGRSSHALKLDENKWCGKLMKGPCTHLTIESGSVFQNPDEDLYSVFAKVWFLSENNHYSVFNNCFFDCSNVQS